jgi:CBS domain-containing protein
MSTKTLVGVSVGGLKTLGQLTARNDLRFYVGQNALAIAARLLSTHRAGAPVVDDRGDCIGFISEFDVLRALDAKKDLSKVPAEDIMAKDYVTITEDSPIEEAVNIMQEERLANLPVRKNGRLAYTVTRQDLFRAWMGMGIGMSVEA